MKVWIDQDLCTGDGLCEEIAPAVFFLQDDGLAYVKGPNGKFGGQDADHPSGSEGVAELPDDMVEAALEAAEECPGECIFIEPE